MASKRFTCKLPMRAGQALFLEARDEFGVLQKPKVKRTRDRSWFMQIEGKREHARWADYKIQACSDIAHSLENGTLPRGAHLW